MKLLLPVMTVLFLSTSCAPVILDINPPKDALPNRLDIASVEVIFTSPIETTRIDPYSSAPNPLVRNIQEQFRSSIVECLRDVNIAGNQSAPKKAKIKISRAALLATNQGIKSVVFIGIFFLGMEEEYSSIIEGTIEIEDPDGRVLDKADIKIHEIEKGKNAVSEQIKAAASLVANKSLVSLRNAVAESIDRYLYKYKI